MDVLRTIPTQSRRNLSISTATTAKADLEGKLQEAEASHGLETTALADTVKYISELHASCDFLTANFDARRAARTQEIEGLQNAKAVLAGADYQ